MVKKCLLNGGHQTSGGAFQHRLTLEPLHYVIGCPHMTLTSRRYQLDTAWTHGQR